MIFRKLLPRWLFQDFFLKWELENWQEIYRNQIGLLSIYYHEATRVLPQVLAFDNTVEKLSLEQIKFRLSYDKFQLDSKFETEKIFKLYKNFSWIHKRKLFNEVCLRLVSIELQQASLYRQSVLFNIQEAEYFDYIQTNLCLDAQLSQEKISLRSQLHTKQNDHCLEDLDSSPLANILGINILIFTLDGTLIFQKRSSRTLVRPNQICSSVSGTLTKADIPEYDKEFSLEELLPSFFREMFEETGLKLSSLSRSEIRFLGLTRELIRGGQPEIFFASQVDLSKSEIICSYSQALDRFESTSLLFFNMGSLATENLNSQDKKSAFCLKFDELVSNYNQAISVPLWTNLALWYKSRLYS